jgi:hypothetical protein
MKNHIGGLNNSRTMCKEFRLFNVGDMELLSYQRKFGFGRKRKLTKRKLNLNKCNTAGVISETYFES